MHPNIVEEKLELGSILEIWGPCQIAYLDRKLNVHQKYIKKDLSDYSEMIDFIYKLDGPKELLSNKYNEKKWQDLLKLLHDNMDNFLFNRNKLFDKITDGSNDSSEYYCYYYNPPWIWTSPKDKCFYIDQTFTVLRVDNAHS